VGPPLVESLPVVGSSVATLMVVEPAAGVVLLLPLVVVPDPQATRIANNKGIPIVKARIRDQLFFMMS
jgi:hypothetical protein